MKKVVIKILIILILFNLILQLYQENFVQAVEARPNDDFSITQEQLTEQNSEGVTKDPSGNKTGVDAANTESSTASIIGNITSPIANSGIAFNSVITAFAQQSGYLNYNKAEKTYLTDNDFSFLTIEQIVFGNYYLFSIDIFNDSSVQKPTNKAGTWVTSGLIKSLDLIRKSVARWYYIVEIIALAIGLVTLIYIGIRMAVSTVATDKAKYKKMLVSWVQSILIIALLPYIITVVNYLKDLIMQMLDEFRGLMITNGTRSFEVNIMNEKFNELENTGGLTSLAVTITAWVLIFAEFKYFMMYLKRFLSVAFLILISPLITITYSIDKAGDGKAQAFGNWCAEYITLVLIQPLQAIIYLIFAFSASEIAIQAPILGIIFLLTLTRAEKILRKLFNIKDLVTIKTMRIFGGKQK